MSFLSSAWAVLVIFLIPWGAGIPGGVLLAKSRGLGWPVMTVLYFISDVILAFIFEPMMHLMIALGKQSPFFKRFAEAMRQSLKKTASLYGSGGGPLTLVMISFLVDPMTGRTAAKAAGHGFISGWTLAITGDMMYFIVLMVSTLWLKSLLGDSRWTMAIMLVLMAVVPLLFRRKGKTKTAGTI